MPADTPAAPAASRLVPRLISGTVIALAVATVAVIALTWPGARPVASPPGQRFATVLATVTAIETEACPVEDPRGCTRARIRIADGSHAGDTGSFVIGDHRSDIRVQVGDRVRVIRTPDKQMNVPGVEVERWSFSDYDRHLPLIWLGLAFVVVVLVAGRWRGLRALIGLGLSVGVVLGYIVPGLLRGDNALLITCAGAVAVMYLTIPLAHGWGLTTKAATLGTAASLGVTVVLALAFTSLAHLTGFGSDDAAYLASAAGNVSIRGLLLGGIVIATLGVLDDVTITQASTVLALRHANPELGYGELFARALSVGRDHITATINTLVLAYAGASLPALLVFAVVDIPVSDVLNGENVASQIVGTLVGSIGLITAVPITTALAALLATHVSPEEIDPHEGHVHG